MSLIPRPQPFDSGILAPSVGFLTLSNGESVDDAAARAMSERAADAGFDLVWIESSRPLETALLDDRGTVVELEGERDEALSRLPPESGAHEVRTVESAADWAVLEELLRFAPSSRFSTDPRVSTQAFRRHKLALLRGHVQNRHGLVSMAYSAADPARAVGCHCTSIDAEGRVVFYDLAVDPEFRRGFVALALIRYNLQRFAREHPDARRVTVRIYDDNEPSLRLFDTLGLTRTGRVAHYYHCWPKELLRAER